MKIFCRTPYVALFFSMFFLTIGGILPYGALIASAEVQLVTEDLVLSNDSILDASDLFLFSAEWGKKDSALVDYNKDGKVNQLDILYLLQSWHGTVTSPTVEITPTPSPTAAPTGTLAPTPSPAVTKEPTATATLTPSPAVTKEPTATATLTPSPAVTKEPTATATPTPSLAATKEPTATATLTPTPAVTKEPTGTVTPTPSPTSVDVPTLVVTPVPTSSATLQPTVVATPTPVLEPSPTNEPSSTPTLTPTAAIKPTATPSPATPSDFEGFSTDFDSIDSVIAAGFVTYDSTQSLVDAGRLSLNATAERTILPWRIADNLAFSDPQSVACNDGSTLGYGENQTSVLDLKQVFKTTNTSKPKLVFQIAYSFEPPFSNTLNDYLVVEASENGAAYHRLKISVDNTYNAFYSAEPIDWALEKSNFKYVEIDLPKCDRLMLSFRFESDSSGNAEGAYLDNIQVLDAGASSGKPVIRAVQSVDFAAFYADAMGKAQVKGSDLTPAGKVLFKTGDAEVSVPFEVVNNILTVTLPPLAQVNQETTGTLTVVRDTGEVSNAFTIIILPALIPQITAVSPSPFFLDAPSARLEIIGSDFRIPVGNAEGSSVIIDLGSTTLEFKNAADFEERSATRLVVNVPQLKQQTPGAATVFVQNPSGLRSKAFTLVLTAGDGSVQVNLFNITLESSVITYDPADSVLQNEVQLQRDQAFMVVWEGTNFTDQRNINIRIGGKSLVISGQTEQIGSPDQKKLDFAYTNLFGTQQILLEIAPMVVDVSGAVTAEIQVGNGAPAIKTFKLLDPMPPVIYSREGDWKSQGLSLNADQYVFIFGDNFRGRGTGHTDPEATTTAFLFPAEITNPAEKDLIPLPSMTDLDVVLQSGIGDSESNADDLRLYVPQGTITKAGKYRIRLLNPDSGLFVDSKESEFVTFTN